jgi:hypothetical protein
MFSKTKIPLRNKKNPNVMRINLTLNKFIRNKDISNLSNLNIKHSSMISSSNLLSPVENKKNNLCSNNDISNETNSNLIKENFSLTELTNIYKTIINQIDLLMNSYNKNSYHHIYSCLIKINNTINQIISEKSNSNNEKKSRNDNKNEIFFKIKNYRYIENDNKTMKSNQSKKIFISELPYNKNKLTRNSFKLIQKNFVLNESIGPKENTTTDNKTRKIKYLRQKMTDLEKKFKIEELNYLFCIGAQQKKISELENRLNLTTVENMPKEELKKIQCFPNYLKFDINEETPQHKIMKPKIQSSIHRRKIPKKEFFDQSKDNNKKNNQKSNEDIDEEKNEGKDNITANNLLKNYKENEENIKKAKEIIEIGQKVFNNQNSSIQQFFNQKKHFFISHPKLNYIKYGSEGFHMKTWKINDMMENMPKQLSKFKLSSKSQKNAIVIFPSSLNETVVNLEKLRVNKNFRSIELKFEESRKLYKQKYNEV